METITEIDLIFSDLKNEVITEKQAHQKVLDLFQSITPMSEEEIREWIGNNQENTTFLGGKIRMLKKFQSQLLSRVEDKKQEDVIDLLFTGMYQCECGSESTGSMQFNLCNICGKDIPKKKQPKATNVEIAKDAEQLFTSQAIQDEMDADMEDGGMAQGEIESCLSHWHNKYLIVMRGELTK